MSSTCYKVLIIGCGNIAGNFDLGRASSLPSLSHAGAYSRHDGFRLSACVDPNDSRRLAFAQHWGVERQAANLTGLDISPGELAVISICSPTDLHQDHLAQALKLRPRVIFCEKPLTTDVSAAEQLVKECREKGVALVVNFSRRWDPALVEVISQLNSGRWGKFRSIVGHYNKGILNNGSHMLDLLLRLAGPLELVATACPELDFWEFDPTVAVLLTAQMGSVPVYLNPAHASDFAYFELEIVCELGVLRMQSSGMDWQFRDVVPNLQFEGYLTLDKARHIEGHYLESMGRAIEDIYAFLHQGTPLGTSGEDAIRVQKLCAQIKQEALKKFAPRNNK